MLLLLCACLPPSPSFTADARMCPSAGVHAVKGVLCDEEPEAGSCSDSRRGHGKRYARGGHRRGRTLDRNRQALCGRQLFRVVGKFNTSTNMFHIDTYYWTSSPGWLGLGIHAGGTTANGGQGAWSYLES